MKRLTLSALALVLATSSSVVLADHDDDYHGDHGHGYKHGHYYRGPWYPRPYYRPVYYYPPVHYYPPVRYYPYYDHHDHHDHDDYVVPLGAALIGAAVTYSIVHTHDTSSSESSSSSNVVGCHRIERYPDGSEHRVEVPIAECN